MRGRSIAGVILIVLSIAGILAWEFIGRDTLMYTEILTVNKDIEQGTVITTDMLGTKQVTAASSKSYRKKDVEKIVGMEATSYIPQGSELYSAFFEDPELLVHASDDEYVLSIPSQWLAANPQSLRRGDKVTFLHRGEFITTATVKYVKDGSNVEVTSDKDRLEASSTVSVIEVIVNRDDAQTMAILAEQDGFAKFVIIYQ